MGFAGGLGPTLLASTMGLLYGMGDDTVFSDNGGGYAVTLVPVPEVGSVALVFAGLDGLTTQLDSRRRPAP